MGGGFTVCALLIAAAPFSTRYAAENWTVREGLPQTSVADVEEDRDGFLWVATFGGIARFDGERFRRADPPRAHRDFDSHRFTAVAIDDDTVYAGVESGRIFRFSRLFLRPAITAITLPREDIIRDIELAPDGTRWIAAQGAGVFALDRDDNVIQDLPLGEDRAMRISFDGDDVLISAEHALIRLRKDGTRTRTPARYLRTVARAGEGVIFVDEGGIHAAGTATAPSTEQRVVSGVYVDGARTWITGDLGLSVIEEGVERRVQLPARRVTGTRIDDDPDMTRMLVGRDGSIWVATVDAGLYRLRDRHVRQLGQQVGLVGDSVLLAAPDATGGAWVSTYCHGVQRLLDGDARVVPVAGVAPGACVSAIAIDGDRGFASADGAIVRLVSDHAVPFVDASVVDDDIFALAPDDRGGVWVGTHARGALHLDDDGRVDRQARGATPPDIRVFTPRPGGGWFVGASDGVYVLGVDGALAPLAPGAKSVMHVRDLFAVDDDHVWAATYGAGLHLVGPDGDLALFASDGFCDDMVSRIVVDGDHVWFNGNGGVFRLPRAALTTAAELRRVAPTGPITLPCLPVDTGEGNGGGTGAGGMLRDGRLVFPTVDGIALLDPRDFRDAGPLPPVRFDVATVDDVPVDVGGFTAVGPGARHLQAQLVTPHIAGDEVRFERTLTSDDGTIVETGSSTLLDYTNLPPGDIALAVRRYSLDGRRGPATVLRFRLAPQLTETLAFRLGAPTAVLALLAAGAAFWVNTVRTRTRALHAELERDAIYRSVFERSPCAIFVHAQNGDLLQLNTAAIAVVGAPSSVADAQAFVAPADRDRYRALLRRTGPAGGLDELKMLTPEGAERTMLVECTRLSLGGAPRTLVAALDITAIRAAEAERAALLDRTATSVRLEGLGRLAGGIAHDFNNVLAALRLQVEVLSSACAEPETVKELAGEMLQAVEHGRDLTKRTSGHAEEVNLYRAVERSAPLLRRLLRSGVTLEIRGGAKSAVVTIDPAHLDQVLMNLVLNAQHASPPTGTVVVSLARNQEIPPGAHEISPAPSGPVVCLAVEDHGTGMSPDVLARAFEPFFSTRGSGSGIGLTVVQRVAQASGAGIHVVTAPGRGTTVMLTFKDHHPEPDRKTSSVDVVPSAAGARGVEGFSGQPCVLVVDDEEFVRGALALVLKRAGYAVITAVDGHDALAALDEAAATGWRVDLVLTDLLMPNMGGVELIGALAQHHAGLPVVVLSAFNGETPPPKDIIQLTKPIDPERLIAVVSAILPLPSTASA